MPHERRSVCPNAASHTDQPVGYIAWHTWAERKMRTHVQQRCEGCGLLAIWVPKARVEVVDIQAEVSYVALCSICGQSADEDGEQYQPTPLKAERVSGFERRAGRLVCSSCVHGEVAA